MELKISEDGKTMRGTATSISGNWSGPIEFRRVQIVLSPVSANSRRLSGVHGFRERIVQPWVAYKGKKCQLTSRGLANK
jgi:hypothetical protein